MTTTAPDGDRAAELSDAPPPGPTPASTSSSPAASGLRTFEQGDVLFRQGDDGSVAYLLEEGSIRLVKKVRNEGRNLTVLRTGDLFGETALLPDSVRSATAIALTSGVARAIQPGSLPDLIASDPEAAADVLRQLVRRLQELEDQIEIMMLSDTQSKIVAALIKLAQKARVEEPQASSSSSGASFEMSPMDLAARVGLDVDTVKRTVQQLREGHYLRVNDGRLEVPDIEALRRLYLLLGAKDDLRSET